MLGTGSVSTKTSNTGTVVKPKNTAKQHPVLVFQTNPASFSVESQKVATVKNIIYAKEFQSKVLPLTVLFDKKRAEPRGQFSHETLIFTPNLSIMEQIKVLVHEMGHVVDVRYLIPDVFGTDLSDDFYSVSWKEYNVRKKDATLKDFVSGYALTNKYEDFAESFTFFVFHNETFQKRAKNSKALQAKYDFFRDAIFDDESFVGLDFKKDNYNIPDYVWDTTKIPINAKNYLFYIK